MGENGDLSDFECSVVGGARYASLMTLCYKKDMQREHNT